METVASNEGAKQLLNSESFLEFDEISFFLILNLEQIKNEIKKEEQQVFSDLSTYKWLFFCLLVIFIILALYLEVRILEGRRRKVIK